MTQKNTNTFEDLFGSSEPVDLQNCSTIIVRCHGEVADITGHQSFPATINDGQPFLLFFHFLMTSYPEIAERIPPGALAFTVNGKPPEPLARLCDGDVIDFWVHPVSSNSNTCGNAQH